MGRSSREEAQATRERLLDAAETICARDGVASLRLSKVACATGLTTGALYWHFRDRDALLTALFERAHGSVQALVQAFRDRPLTFGPHSSVKQFCRRFLDATMGTLERACRSRIWLIQMELSRTNVLAALFQRAVNDLRDALRLGLIAAARASRRDESGCEARAWLLTAQLLGILRLALGEIGPDKFLGGEHGYFQALWLSSLRPLTSPALF